MTEYYKRFILGRWRVCGLEWQTDEGWEPVPEAAAPGWCGEWLFGETHMRDGHGRNPYTVNGALVTIRPMPDDPDSGEKVYRILPFGGNGAWLYNMEKVEQIPDDCRYRIKLERITRRR